MAASVSKVDRSVLLTIPNPRYADKIHQYPHLQGVFMNDEDKKPELPIHLLLPIFSKTKGGTISIKSGWIGFSKSSEKSSLSLTFSLALLITEQV